MSADLSGARTKLDRAQQQLYALGHAFMAYAERKPYRLLEEFDLRPGENIGDYRYIVSDLKAPPAFFAVQTGELIHNLRSALDYMAFGTAKRPWHKTQFPIFRRCTDWAEKSGPMVKSIPPRYVAIMEETQPYRAPVPGEHLLAILNHLSNRDKHRLLHTTAATLVGAAPGFKAARGVAAIHEILMHFGVLEEGTELAKVVLEPDEPDPEMNMYGEFDLAIAFRDTSSAGRAIDGEPIIRVMFEVGRYVEKIYARFSAA